MAFGFGQPILGGMFNLPSAGMTAGLGRALMAMGGPQAAGGVDIGRIPGVQLHPPLVSQGAVAHQGYTNPILGILDQLQQQQQQRSQGPDIRSILQTALGPTSQAGWSLGTRTQPTGLLGRLMPGLFG